MEHLTVDEIIDFISLTELNNEAIVLSSAVNGHIRKCKDCLKLVKSFQIIYDEFSARNNTRENIRQFRGCCPRNIRNQQRFIYGKV